MSENDELERIKRDIGGLSSKIEHLYRRVDEAHGEARAGNWLLTEMLHILSRERETLVDDSFKAFLPFPSDKPLSPVDRAAISALYRLRDSIRR